MTMMVVGREMGDAHGGKTADDRTQIPTVGEESRLALLTDDDAVTRSRSTTRHRGRFCSLTKGERI